MAEGKPLHLDESDSLYAYAITASPLDAEVLQGVSGVEEETSVFSAEIAGFGVTLDRVPTADWTGPTAEERLRQIAWVGPRALLHEEVVSETSTAEQTFPLPFGTLFSSVSELTERVESYADVIEGYFERTRGCEEWAVKGVIDRDVVEEHLMGGEDGPSGGADYLRRRKQVQETRKEVEPWLNTIVTPFWEALTLMTHDNRVLSTKASRQASEEDIVFNWAFLVETERRAQFEEAIDTWHAKYVESGVGLRLSGPWAPYSFRPALPDANPAG